ncbi:putative odorant receptor 65b [Anticarsia gemmatalis]|uniref:putative odorant receptor 65b n=1 Tax=Anticarsia gemmatalis TaxID=129554 RepID=UPI003F75ABB1
MAVSVLARFYTFGDGFFDFNLKYLFIVGLWPEEDLNETQRFFYKGYETTLHVFTVLLFIITGIGLYENRDDLTAFLTNLDKTLVAYNFFFKTVPFVYKRDKLKELIEEIKNSGDVVTEERKQLMYKGTITITGISVVLISVFSLVAIFEGEMSIEAWMPFDPLEDRMKLILSAQILAALFLPGLFRAFAMQGLVCCLIIYLCDQLVDVQKKMRNIKYTEDGAVEVRKKFREAIKKHVRLMRYAQEMEQIFKEYFLVQHLAITVELCLNAIMVTVVSDITLLVSFLVYLGLALLNAYIYSYLGNELIIQSQGIAMAGYEAPWTSWPLDMQKDLLILIRAAQRPLALSAGGMELMSIQTFSKALYNGYSIFAVLNDMVD